MLLLLAAIKFAALSAVETFLGVQFVHAIVPSCACSGRRAGFLRDDSGNKEGEDIVED